MVEACQANRAARVSLDEVLVTAELARRPPRPPDYEAETRALAGLVAALSDAPDSVLQKLVDTAVELCRADSAGISILEPGEGASLFRWHAIAGPLAGHLSGGLPRRASPAGTVLDRNAPQLFASPERHFDCGMAIEPPIIEALLVPFSVAAKPVGTVWAIAHTPQRQFDREDQRVLTSLSRFASAAYQMTATLRSLRKPLGTCAISTDIADRKSAEQALAERTRLAHLMAEIGVALTRTGSLPEILQCCAEAFVRHLEVAFARIWTLSETSEVLELQASAGLYTHRNGSHSRMPVGHLKIGLIAQERKPHLTNAVIGDSRVNDQEWARREGMVAFAGHPLIYRDRVVGVMAMFSRQPLSATILQTLASVADSIAHAIAHEHDVEALRLSEERFNLAIRGTDQGIWDWNLLTNEFYQSPRFKELIGYQEHDQQDHFAAFETRLHPQDRDQVLQAMWSHLEQRSPYQVDHRLRTKTGDYRWFHTRGQALWDANGRPVRMLGSMTDITDRKCAEQALKRLNETLEQQVAARTQDLHNREERLKAILNATVDAIITTDRQGAIQSVNPATEKMFGYTAAELIGRNIRILMPAHHHDEAGDYMANYLRTGTKRVLHRAREVVARRKDGSTFPADLAMSEVPQLKLFTGIARDITRRKELEREVVGIASREQRRIGQDLHDSVGQELTALNLLAGDLTETWQTDPAKGAKLVRRMAEGLRRCKDELRAVMRGLLPVQVDSLGLMAALTDLAERTAKDGTVACTFDCTEPVAVQDNLTATHLYLVAQEAVHNALIHARPRNIQIALHADDRLTLRVQDDGIGIPRLEEEAKGLGLRIMSNRAEIIGATLTIEPIEPSGTCVTCFLVRGSHDQSERQTSQSAHRG